MVDELMLESMDDMRVWQFMVQSQKMAVNCLEFIRNSMLRPL